MVRAETAGGIARIALDRPEKKNAFTAEMYRQLGDALAAADAAADVRAVLLHGTSECFSAGNDLADFLKPRRPDEESPATALFRTLPVMRKPVVAAVAGPAIGIGCTLLLHCDLVYAGENARFQLPFVPLGIVPEFGSTLLLPLLAGYQRAAELLLLGEPFTAEQAREAGIVNAVVASAEVLQIAERKARALAALPPESVRLTKALLKATQRGALEARIAEESRIFAERLASPEAKAAMRAFLEMRKA
ncbi:MAG: enoyl-CoA hydratase [Betaproteobacteria bacterium]|nr:MAG: enoyl-CoA hydratase [Betaproteobacteria bacterium]